MPLTTNCNAAKSASNFSSTSESLKLREVCFADLKGLKAIEEKGKSLTPEKIHSIDASEPSVAGNSIAFTLGMDLTMKGRGRMNSPELCVYQLKDGKIISEEFFV